MQQLHNRSTANAKGVGSSELVVPQGVEAEVCADIAARQQKGVAKYGTTVEANPLSLEQWLQHAYEECLDQAVYLKKCIAVTKRHNSSDMSLSIDDVKQK